MIDIGGASEVFYINTNGVFMGTSTNLYPLPHSHRNEISYHDVTLLILIVLTWVWVLMNFKSK